MKFIDDLLGGLFPGKNSKLAIRENFTISREEEDKALGWANSPQGKATLKSIYDNYHLKKAGVNKAPEVHVLQSPYANGFAVSFQAPLTNVDFSRLFIALGQGILGLGYRKVSLDRKIEEIHDLVRVTEKYYFKPPLSVTDPENKIDQLFGNISLEKIYLNNKPNFLKVLVTVYADRLYFKPAPFEQFMDQLFKAD
ncbi:MULTISPECIES: hypothetical protein [Cyclobacterium]|uniref:Uncharacterized protein n=1 Tax=Cyclobacterium plantarum TaxID=2716263 RepID=A0ABX0H5M3_9BACT|nr:MULTISPECIES: hypothetical protein [Cyclobacterium]MBD3627404.1 hypothetical protein [Cyclobacterium sp.]NHE55668.1 hypothetical protein [Cyclobacterium plantarum]